MHEKAAIAGSKAENTMWKSYEELQFIAARLKDAIKAGRIFLALPAKELGEHKEETSCVYAVVETLEDVLVQVEYARKYLGVLKPFVQRLNDLDLREDNGHEEVIREIPL